VFHYFFYRIRSGSTLIYQQKKNQRILIVSDLHIKNPQDARCQRFLSFLCTVDSAEVSHLILLGDIFDFCFGMKTFYRKKFSEVGAALTCLAEKGVKVLYLEGNHEFALKYLGWQGVTFINSESYLLQADSQTKILLAHGDHLIAKKLYKIFKFITKSFPFYLLASFVPGSVIDKICLCLSKRSKDSRYKKEQQDFLPVLLQEANFWLDGKDTHHGVFGHFHKQILEKRKKKSEGHIVCLNSWSKPNYLLFHQGIFKHYDLSH